MNKIITFLLLLNLLAIFALGIDLHQQRKETIDILSLILVTKTLSITEPQKCPEIWTKLSADSLNKK